MHALQTVHDRPEVGGAPTSVLIVDDSAVARAALSHMVDASPNLRRSGSFDGARRAIDWLRDHSVDVVLLDLEMPGWDGLTALPELLTAGRGAKILVVSSTARAGAEATVRALAAGAADTLAKPAVGHLNQNFQAVLIDRIERLGRASTGRDCDTRLSLRPEPVTPVALLGIGASTGGLSALSTFFAALPATFAAPILVTQHLPPAFMPYFAEQLASIANRAAHVAQSGHVLVPGEIVVAPGHAHLIVTQYASRFRVGLSETSTPNRCCPSVDPMFMSMADAAGAGAAVVVLTGMGRDGMIGAEKLVEAGGSVLAQDRHSSAVWGMPGSIALAGLACAVGTPDRLASHLSRRGSL